MTIEDCDRKKDLILLGVTYQEVLELMSALHEAIGANQCPLKQQERWNQYLERLNTALKYFDKNECYYLDWGR